MEELGHVGAPKAVRAWLNHIPSWIDVHQGPTLLDAGLASLDMGERQAIQLAEEKQADLLLIDERKGRNEAKRRGLGQPGLWGFCSVRETWG